uniref:COesterase domain-containing protein n=1 Tax=Macrostomum lignano TaxID=282301 RepID=A0A1I8FPH1_9PLAT
DSASLATVPCQDRTTALRIKRLALEFLRDQLHRFGGDPARVTLAGHGAAAAAVGPRSACTRLEAADSRASSLMSGPWPPPRRRAVGLAEDLLDAESLLWAGLRRRRLVGSRRPSTPPRCRTRFALWRLQRLPDGRASELASAGAGGAGASRAGRRLRARSTRRHLRPSWTASSASFPASTRPAETPRCSGRRYLRLTLSDWPHFAYGGRVRQILARALSDFWRRLSQSRLASSSAGAFDFLRFGAKTGVNSTSGGFAFEPGRCPLWSAEMSLASNLSASPPPPQPPPPPPPARISPGVCAAVLEHGAAELHREYSRAGQGWSARQSAPPLAKPKARVSAAGAARDLRGLPLPELVWTPCTRTGTSITSPSWCSFTAASFRLATPSMSAGGAATCWTRWMRWVTVAYRLGALGFLWLQNASVPANLGLRDQRWPSSGCAYNVALFWRQPQQNQPGGAEAGLPPSGFHLLTEPAAVPARRPSVGLAELPLRGVANADEVECGRCSENFTASYLNCSQSARLSCWTACATSTSSKSSARPQTSQRDVAGPPARPSSPSDPPWTRLPEVQTDRGRWTALPRCPLAGWARGTSRQHAGCGVLLPDGLKRDARARGWSTCGQSLRHFPAPSGESLSSVGLEAASRRFAEFPSSTADAAASGTSRRPSCCRGRWAIGTLPVLPGASWPKRLL